MQPLGDAHGKFVFVLQVAINEKIIPVGIVLNGGDAVFGDVGKDQLDAVAALRRRRFGDVLLDKADCGAFFEHAGEFAVGVAFEFAALGIGRVLRDMGQLKRDGVCDRYVAGDVCKEDGIFWRDRVELLLGGEFFVGPEGVVPAAAGDPIAFFVGGYGTGYALLQFFRGGDTVQADCEHVGGGIAQMDVGVVEAGHYEFVAELDGFGVFFAATAFEHDLLDTADADDFAFADSH